MKRILALLPLLALAGCASAPKGSVMGSECKAFERPEYAVKGKRQYDQDWIDSTIEGGVGACGWKRPASRPAALDAKPTPVKAKPAPAAKPKAWLRFVQALRHKPAVETPVIEPVAEPVPAPQKPLRPIDKLLGSK